MLAMSFWHILFSRIGFRAIMAPLLLVFALYFFWRGLRDGRLYNYALSGMFWGLGFYTYISFRIMPVVLLFTFITYWYYIYKKFDKKKYIYVRNIVGKGIIMTIAVGLIVALPIIHHFWVYPEDFLSRTGQLSIFSSPNISSGLGLNIVKTLGMFTFSGDSNWRHNFSGTAQLLWPIGILFIIGFFRAIYKLVKTYIKKKYLATAQVMLLLWFFIGLLPVVISNESIPHSLRAIIVIPVIYIFAGEGLWWMYNKTKNYYMFKRLGIPSLNKKKYAKDSMVMTAVMIVFLIVCGIFQYDKYFNKWARNPNVPAYFNENYVEIGRTLNEMPVTIKKYVIVNSWGILVNGIPMPAQTVMFITDTFTPEKQKVKNIFYLTEKQYNQGEYDMDYSIILPLEPR